MHPHAHQFFIPGSYPDYTSPNIYTSDHAYQDVARCQPSMIEHRPIAQIDPRDTGPPRIVSYIQPTFRHAIRIPMPYTLPAPRYAPPPSHPVSTLCSTDPLEELLFSPTSSVSSSTASSRSTSPSPRHSLSSYAFFATDTHLTHDSLVPYTAPDTQEDFFGNSLDDMAMAPQLGWPHGVPGPYADPQPPSWWDMGAGQSTDVMPTSTVTSTSPFLAFASTFPTIIHKIIPHHAKPQPIHMTTPGLSGELVPSSLHSSGEMHPPETSPSKEEGEKDMSRAQKIKRQLRRNTFHKDGYIAFNRTVQAIGPTFSSLLLNKHGQNSNPALPSSGQSNPVAQKAVHYLIGLNLAILARLWRRDKGRCNGFNQWVSARLDIDRRRKDDYIAFATHCDKLPLLKYCDIAPSNIRLDGPRMREIIMSPDYARPKWMRKMIKEFTREYGMDILMDSNATFHADVSRCFHDVAVDWEGFTKDTPLLHPHMLAAKADMLALAKRARTVGSAPSSARNSDDEDDEDDDEDEACEDGDEEEGTTAWTSMAPVLRPLF
eukprot:TRINITY_DN2811_c0_g1_i1.p1 TRINITY_DN2811_c0_g1~~TRINITY_DN2811_c0_g1_i1.p1  ORF type:complete len:544 (-),score=154.75 TRINITY_DN2811_c0_g1_i1:51-1682(-)